MLSEKDNDSNRQDEMLGSPRGVRIKPDTYKKEASLIQSQKKDKRKSNTPLMKRRIDDDMNVSADSAILPKNSESNSKPQSFKLPEIEALLATPSTDSIWAQILDPDNYTNAVVMPALNEEVNTFLERTIDKTKFSAKYRNKLNKFNDNMERISSEIEHLTVRKILHNFSDIVEVLKTHSSVDDLIILTQNDLKIVTEIYEVTTKYQALRNHLLSSLSTKSRIAEHNRVGFLSVIIKNLKYFSPENSHYVMNLVGEAKYKQIISQSIFFISNSCDFLLKQYREELAENLARVSDVFNSTEKLLHELVRANIIRSSAHGKYEPSSDFQSIIYIILQVWEKVCLDLKPDSPVLDSFAGVHKVKVIELTLSILIALSRHMINEREYDPTFSFYIKVDEEDGTMLYQLLIDQFASLITQNLGSTNNWGRVYGFFGMKATESRSFQSIKPETFLHMIEFCQDCSNSPEPNEAFDKQKNDFKFNLHREQITHELSSGDSFLLNKSFSNVYYIDGNGIPLQYDKMDQDSRIKHKETNDDLGKVMKAVSTSIASRAGFKTAGLEIKIASFFRYLVTSGLTYILNSIILKRWCSDKTVLLLYLPAYKIIDSQIRKIIDWYDRGIKQEHEKYNKIYHAFNHNIRKLVDLNYIYPILSDTTDSVSINNVQVKSRLKVYTRVISETIVNTLESIGAERDTSRILDQDFAAISMVSFNALTIFAIQEASGNFIFKLTDEDIGRVSSTLGTIIAGKLSQDTKTQKYSLDITPEELFTKLITSLHPYMMKKKIDIEPTSNTALHIFKSAATSVLATNRLQNTISPPTTSQPDTVIPKSPQRKPPFLNELKRYCGESRAAIVLPQDTLRNTNLPSRANVIKGSPRHSSKDSNQFL